MVNSYNFGIKAEALAAEYLRRHKYVIINKRYKTKYGEIDLITLKDNSIIFIEIKYRKMLLDAHYALTERQCKRIINAAQYFFSENENYINYDCRVDLIIFNSSFNLKHYENIISSDN
ncbi:MAG: YraN family protein [Sphingobacteriia bacterium]|nr:YraN family protein [Sphingobacteriia bacterium]